MRASRLQGGLEGARASSSSVEKGRSGTRARARGGCGVNEEKKGRGVGLGERGPTTVFCGYELSLDEL
jgi:hypothetical protein